MPSRSLHASLDMLSTASSETGLNRRRARIALRADQRRGYRWSSKFDVVNVLGGEGEEGRGDGISGVYGHTGCINALSWSPDGSLLASGSDDTRLCLWKVGQEPLNGHPNNPDIVQKYSPLGLGLTTTIHTGHRANIFSVKFSPTSNEKLYSAAGDHEVRVFDLAQGAVSGTTHRSTSTAARSGAAYNREWTEHARGSAVCTRVLRCHRGRVKRIATEALSDSLFLTCSEDGTVRQHDLRVGHACKSHCPPPLCSYREHGMGLYSLSTTPLRPELFVVAGTSEFAFLHDRRLVPRSMMQQWGTRMNPNELTQCVRRFGPPMPPLIPEEPPDEIDEELDGEQDGEEDELNSATAGAYPESRRNITRQTAQAARRNAQRRRMLLRQSRSRAEQHVTAAKLSATNGRDLLVTYSGGPVCLYDIFAEPESRSQSSILPNNAQETRSGQINGELKDQSELKRVKALNIASEAAGGHNVVPEDLGSVNLKRKMRGMPPLTAEECAMLNETVDTRSSPPPIHSASRSLTCEDTLVDTSTASESQDTPDEQDASAPPPMVRASRAASFLRSPPAETEGADAQAATDALSEALEEHGEQFEIRVGDDGEIEIVLGGPVGMDSRFEIGSANEETGSDGDSDVLHEAEDISDEQEAETSDSDGISESDALSEPSEHSESGGRHADIPLIRPHRIYTGHRNVDTVKDVNFGGGTDELVLSGSDDGNVFIWDRDTSELMGIWKGDESVVNVLQWHPTLPVMAVSGIDNSIKILAPTNCNSKTFSRFDKRDEISAKNKDETWTSRRLMGSPSSGMLLRLLSELDSDDASGITRRVPLQALLQLAGDSAGGPGERDCRVM